MTYVLVAMWLVNGQVSGRVMMTFDGPQAHYACEQRIRGNVPLVCIPVETKP